MLQGEQILSFKSKSLSDKARCAGKKTRKSQVISPLKLTKKSTKCFYSHKEIMAVDLCRIALTLQTHCSLQKKKKNCFIEMET